VKPYIADMQNKLKEEGVKALGSFLGKIMEKKAADKLEFIQGQGNIKIP